MSEIFSRLLFAVIGLSLALASCSSYSKKSEVPVEKVRESAFLKILAHDLPSGEPLGGQFIVGTNILRNADAAAEANEIFKQKGPTLILLTASLVPPGVDTPAIAKKIIESKKFAFVKIPATGDYIVPGSSDYFDAAGSYAYVFNKRMLTLTKDLRIY
jgi:hypothetical protein